MILLGDCLERLKELEENSVDSVVTDPPYGWRFMGKAWDGADIEKTFARDKTLETDNKTTLGMAAGKYNQSLVANQAFQTFSESYAKELFRVLKPGGHMLIFCGPRTYHRMASGVEDAGFEIRDQLQWLFGSGFPKSHNIDKAIDRHLGTKREVIGTIQQHGTALKPANEPIVLARKPLEKGLTVAQNMLKWGVGGLNIDISRIKPGNEPLSQTGQMPLVSHSVYADILESVPHSFSEFCALSWPTVQDFLRRISSELSACNISDKDLSHGLVECFRNHYSEFVAAPYGYGPQEMRADECVLRAKEAEGFQSDYPTLFRLCDELLRSLKVSDLNAFPSLDDVLADISFDLDSKENIHWCDNNLRLFCVWVFAYAIVTAKRQNNKDNIQSTDPQGRWPANLLLDETAAQMLDEQAPTVGGKWSAIKKADRRKGNTFDVGVKNIDNANQFVGDSGGASRFFYVAKASKRERNAGLEGMPEVTARSGMGGKMPVDDDERDRFQSTQSNHHPTVKPIKLMEDLCKLITPVGGVILDPFCGSGSTGVAAFKNGFKFIGIEMNEEYKIIAEKRIEAVL